MNNPDSQEIIARFFLVLDLLKERKAIRGKKTFTDRYNINRRNLNALSHNHASDIFQPAWLTYLVRDYGVSPHWLLLGEGAPLPPLPPTPPPPPKRKRGRPKKIKE